MTTGKEVDLDGTEQNRRLTPHFVHSDLDVVGFHSFIFLSAWTFVLCNIDLAAQPHSTSTSVHYQQKADEGGHGGYDEDGFQGFGISACFLAGWLGQSGGNTAWVAGSCTVSGWASLAVSVVSCCLWLGSGELGNGTGGNGRYFPWSFFGLSWWHLAGWLGWFGRF
jgi:hypothetical protein